MDLSHIISQLTDFILFLATKSRLALAFWAAVLWLIVFITRRPIFRHLFHWFGIADAAVESEIVNRVDLPFQLLLVVMASSPFLPLLRAPIGAALYKAAIFTCWLLALHLILQSANLLVFRWYLGHKRGIIVPAIFRFVILAVIYIAGILWLMDWVVGINVLPFLATSTVLTAVLGLALQDTLKNVFAGLTLSLEHSFHKGDWVAIRQADSDRVLGEILEISWRSTKIRTPRGNLSIIPNSQFTNYELINYTQGRKDQGCRLQVPVAPKAEPNKVRLALIEAAAGVADVLQEPKPSASPVELVSGHVNWQLDYSIARLDNKEKITGEVLEAAWQKLSQIDALI